MNQESMFSLQLTRYTVDISGEIMGMPDDIVEADDYTGNDTCEK